MTRDVFDIPFGTLDVIVAAVLIRLGIGASLSTWDGPDTSPDAIAERNARAFIEHFGDRRIAAIKEVRDATGLGLRDAKDAVVQLHQTYADPEYYGRKAAEAILDQDWVMVQAYAKRAQEAGDERFW